MWRCNDRGSARGILGGNILTRLEPQQLNNDRIRCQASTRKGSRCSRLAGSGNYCWQHSEDDWQQLELVLSRIQRQLVPDAEVKHDHWIRGKSGRMRKLDIAVFQQVGPYSLLIAFDCKRYSKPVKREKVVIFEEQLDDVNANLGVMVSSAGFDEGAKAFVKEKRILLQTFREATSVDWNGLLGESSWLTLVVIRPRDLIAFAEPATDLSPARIPLETIIFNSTGEPEIQVRELCEQMINELHVPPGHFRLEFSFIEGSAFLRTRNQLLELSKLNMRGQAVGKRYIVNLHLAEGKVLEDETSGQRVYANLVSTSFNWLDVIAKQVGEELSAEQYDQLLQSQALTARLEHSHPYIRVSATWKGEDNNESIEL